MVTTAKKRILVTGGATFLGYNITAALLAEGVDVTVLVRPEAQDHLGPLKQHVTWWAADVWDTASLRGRARGHQMVIHTVGSMMALPEQGLTYHRMNFVSARNVATMCVSDGVPEMILLSSVRAPWINRKYIQSKREAEQYVERVGVQGTVIRSPLVYDRGQQRVLFFRLMTLLGTVPPISWLGFNRIAPIPVDLLARGVARLALEPERNKHIYYASDMRRRIRRDEHAIGLPIVSQSSDSNLDDTQPKRPTSMPERSDDEIPFGWMPTDRTDQR